MVTITSARCATPTDCAPGRSPISPALIPTTAPTMRPPSDVDAVRGLAWAFLLGLALWSLLALAAWVGGAI